MTQSSLKADGVLAFGKSYLIIIAVLIGQSLAVPVVLIGKGYFLKFCKRNLTVDKDSSVGHTAACVVLTRLYHYIVKTILGYFKFPLNPHAVASPGISANVVEHGGGNTRRRSGR